MKKYVSLFITIIVLISGCGKSEELQNVLENKSTEDIITMMYEEKNPGLELGFIPIDLSDSQQLKQFTGIEDASQVKEVSVSEPMISAQAYSLVLVRVSDTEDPKKIADQMIDKINPQKWVCVGADDIQAAGCGDLVIFVMMSSAMSDQITSTNMIDAFESVCGKKLDFLEIK